MNIKIFKKPDKELLFKVLMVIIVVCIALLGIDVFSNSTDGRRQIVDKDGAEEVALCSILSGIKGAGNIDVMIKHDEKNAVTGVIVLSSGAGKATVKNDLTNAVAALYDIPIRNVMVFEKEAGGE